MFVEPLLDKFKSNSIGLKLKYSLRLFLVNPKLFELSLYMSEHHFLPYLLQEFKNALREDTVDYAVYTANIKKRRPPAARRGGRSSSKMAVAVDEDYDDDEDWGSGARRLNSNNNSMRRSSSRIRQRM